MPGQLYLLALNSILPTERAIGESCCCGEISWPSGRVSADGKFLARVEMLSLSAAAIWSERWHETWVRQRREAISREGTCVTDGRPYDCWDLEVAGGALARARLLIAVEHQGAGTQHVRYGIWPKCSRAGQ